MDKEIVWLIRGSQRKEVFINLPEMPFLPNKFRKELNDNLKTNLSLREISRHIKDFEKMSILKCINKEDPYNRIYQITPKGKKIMKNILKLKI